MLPTRFGSWGRFGVRAGPVLADPPLDNSGNCRIAVGKVAIGTPHIRGRPAE